MHAGLGLLLVGGFLAAADGGTEALESGVASLTVTVGKTAGLDVGYARGLLCDDVSLMRVELEGGASTNRLVVTGLQPGTTHCRVGTGQTGPHVVVAVTVLPSSAKE